MKLFQVGFLDLSEQVTPFAGVWIEMSNAFLQSMFTVVTPFAGVWIEIQIFLKQSPAVRVTPFAGVWIEIYIAETDIQLANSHSLRGSVD